MRGTVPGLPSPYPIVGLLPAVYQEEDPFVARFTAGLDDVLAPVLSTLDCLAAYVDPYLTPEDFLDWLGGWVGAVVDGATPLPVRRAAVARAAELHHGRGTVAGLRALVELLTGDSVSIVDSGGVAWSPAPDTPLPGTDEAPWVRLRVAADPDGTVDAAVAAARPAHVRYSVEVVNP